jgi:preprotein translocase subunit YajC
VIIAACVLAVLAGILIFIMIRKIRSKRKEANNVQ